VKPRSAGVACALLAAALPGALASMAARADVTVPAGASISLDAGGLDLACTDLTIAGTFALAQAAIAQDRNLGIAAGGKLDAGSGSIAVAGNWSNAGTFVAGTSKVTFGDGCGVTTAIISGETTFHDLSFTSATGKTWQFPAGSTQTVEGRLDIASTGGGPLQFHSSVPGTDAFIDVNGPHDIDDVTRTNVEFLLPSQAAATPVPALDRIGVAALILTLSLAVVATWPRRRHSSYRRRTRS
jgi:hypothetical protein